jgi:geranylgeranyl diphosphate synthase type II
MANWMEDERRIVDEALDRVLPAESCRPVALHRAMRYSMFAGGKRVRPLLCRAASRALSGEAAEAALIPACALEMVHTYSLIHDDLPALDNDDLRRGRPTCHKAFGEATAILAGDALLTGAFALLATFREPEICCRLVRELAEAAGTPAGMVAGQVADLEANRDSADLDTVRFIHRYKTAALMRAAVIMGAVVARASQRQIESLARFGELIGLAFQITDDILDVTSNSALLGKTAGKDARSMKATWTSVVGLGQSEAQARELHAEALALVEPFGRNGAYLKDLADLIVKRTH